MSLNNQIREATSSILDAKNDILNLLRLLRQMERHIDHFGQLEATTDETTDSLLLNMETDMVPQIKNLKKFTQQGNAWLQITKKRWEAQVDKLRQENERLHIKKIRRQANASSYFSIQNMNNQKSRMYGNALQGNTKIEELAFYLESFGENEPNRDDFIPIIRFIERSSSLKLLQVQKFQNEVAAISLFHAASKNINITNFAVIDAPVPFEIMQRLLFQSQSMQHLRVSQYCFNQRHPILWTPQINLKHAFRHNKTLQTLVLGNFDFLEDDDDDDDDDDEKGVSSSFRDSIQKSCSLRELELENCRFHSRSTRSLMKLLLRSKSNIKKLTLNCCTFETSRHQNLDAEIFVRRLIQRLRPVTKLEEIEMRKKNGSYIGNVAPILNLFQNNNQNSVKSIDLMIISRRCLIEIIYELPFLRALTKFRFQYDFVLFEEEVVHLVQAMKKNYSLTEFKVEDVHPFGGLPEQEEIDVLCMRNKDVQSWMNQPQGMLDSYFPHVLFHSLQYEFNNEIMFNLLKNRHWIPLPNDNDNDNDDNDDDDDNSDLTHRKRPNTFPALKNRRWKKAKKRRMHR